MNLVKGRFYCSRRLLAMLLSIIFIIKNYLKWKVIITHFFILISNVNKEIVATSMN